MKFCYIKSKKKGMKKMTKKVFCCLLMLCLVVTFMPTTAMAADGSADSVLDISGGTIIITDTGYSQGNGVETPWEEETNHAITVTGTSTTALIDIKGGNPQITLQNLTINMATVGEPAIVLEDGGKTATLIIDGTVNLEGAQGNPAIAIMKDSTLTIEGKTGIKNDKLYTTAKDGSQTHTIGTGIGTTQCKKYTSNGELSQLSGGNLVIRNVYIKPEGSGFCAIGDRGKFDSTPSAVGFGNITIEDAQLQFSRKALGSYRSPDIGSSLGKIILKGTNRIGATNGIFSEVGYEVEGKTQTDASARIEIVSVDEGITLSPYLIVGTYQPARLSYTLAEGIDTVKKGVYFDITNGTYTPDGKIKATKLGNYTVIQITAK